MPSISFSPRAAGNANHRHEGYYFLSNVRYCAYLLAVMAFLWFAEVGWFVPRHLSIHSINKIHSTADLDDEDERADIRLTAYEMAIEYPDECGGKERVLEILLKAGKPEISVEDCRSLPAWDTVTSLYGEEPVVYGLDTCELYRETLRRHGNAQPDPRVAGLFDTGTNAFVDALDVNFRHLPDKQRDYQLLGGKHVLVKDRKWVQRLYDGENGGGNVTSELPTFLPIVLIRDPFRWMASMVRSNGLGEKLVKACNVYFVHST